LTAFAPRTQWPQRGRWRLGATLAALLKASSPEPSLRAVATSEPELLRQRDPGAWRALFEREMPAIYQYSASRLGSPTEAEDATSEVFEAAWEHAGSFADQGLPARAWLFGIARNVVNTRRRKWVQRPPALALETFDGGEADPALDPALIDLAHAVGALDQGYAEVITLRFLHGLSLQETADVLRTTVDAVKGRQARALVEMRKTLG
jgi:RNA polymerase sigma-70 factor (ECF subfamily)